MRYYASTNANIWSPYIGNGSYVAQVYLTGGHLYTNDGTAHDLGTQSTGQWYLIELRNFNFTAHTFDVYRNGLSLVAGAAMASGSSNTNKLYCGNWNSTGYDIWYDNLRVRNFRSVEPTWTSWAAQESNIYPVWRSIGSGIGTGIL